MATHVHPTAVVHPSAVLSDHVEIGPFCLVGENVELGKHTRLISQVCIQGPCQIGEGNVVFPFAVLGGDPQHRNYAGEPTLLRVGNKNTFREHVTVHRGTAQSGGVTSIGNDCLLMAGAHVAHDASVGSQVTLTNGVLLGGHVQVDDWVVAAGHVAVAPFARVGTSAFLAGNAMIERDVPPFVIAAGDRATVRAINRVGLQRRRVPKHSVQQIHRAFLLLYPQYNERASMHDPRLQALGEDPFVAQLCAFLQSPSKLGIIAHHRRGCGGEIDSSGPSGKRAT